MRTIWQNFYRSHLAKTTAWECGKFNFPYAADTPVLGENYIFAVCAEKKILEPISKTTTKNIIGIGYRSTPY